MRLWVARGLCFMVVASACGCGLDSRGLLDVRDASKESGGGPDGRVFDTTAGDVEPPTDDGGPSTDALGTMDTGPDVTVDATDAMADAPDAPADVSMDTEVDARADSGPRPIVWDGGTIADPPFVDTDWVSFCAALAACGQMPSTSACLAFMHQPTSPDALIPPLSLINNVVNNAAPNCAMIAQVLGEGSACPAATADTCSGNSLVTCRWGFRMTINCGPLGMVCSNGNGNVGCGFGDCAAAQEGNTYCVGPYYVARCSNGRYAPLVDCLAFGATCAGPAATAQCQGSGGATCNGGAVCNGASIDTCMGGNLVSADCAALYGSNFTCVTTNASVPICAAGAACDPATYVDTCNGMNQVIYCNAGAPGNFNCRGNGWNRCLAGRCVP